MNRFQLLSPLAFALALAPTSGAQEIASIPLPSLCEPAAPPPSPAALRDGAHIVLRIDRSGGDAPRAPFLAAPLLTRMLEQQAREAETNLRVIPGDRPLLVSGDAEAIELARETRQDLDSAGRRLEIKLEVRLRSTTAAAEETDPERAATMRERAWKTTVRSGEEAFFGERQRRPFLSTFDVEVSADAGATDPVAGHVFLGETLHLQARRLRSGTAIHLNGVLDLAELLSTAEFDPDNLELGRLQQPEVASVLVQFSDVIDSGEISIMTLTGLPLSTSDWILEIRASTTPEPFAQEDPSGWALLDLAFLSSESGELPPSAYAEDWEGGAHAIPRAFPAWNANAVQGLLESAVPGVLRPAAGRGAPLVVGNRLLLLDRRSKKPLQAAFDLVEAAETSRTLAGRLKVSLGEQRTTFDVPFTANDPLRIQFGIERTYLTDYTVEIAPETWMPVPEVSAYFEGLQIDAGLIGASTLVCELSRRGMTEHDHEVSSDVTNQGTVQWPTRSVSAARVLCHLGEDAVSVFNKNPEQKGGHIRVKALAKD